MVRRSIGTPLLKHLTPFLMLDHATVGDGAGFPDHPHRGQETITYVLNGAIDHEDFAGNKGTIFEGDLQFMTAGKGIMHAEMPVIAKDGSDNVGMQLWVDLPKELKMCEPRYRDLRDKEIPRVTSKDEKVKIKVISGRSQGVDSVQDLAYTPVWFLDVTIKPGGTLEQELPEGWNAFAYVLNGAVTFNEPTANTDDDTTTQAEETTLPRYHIGVFTNTPTQTHIRASIPEGSNESSRFILVAGQPLDQPIVQYGPFVTTSRDEIMQAMMDFQTHSNGFERADRWESGIGKRHGRLAA